MYIYIYPDAFSTDSIRCIYPLLPFGRDIVETPKRLSIYMDVSIWIPVFMFAYACTRTYVHPCIYVCLSLSVKLLISEVVYIDR